MRTDILVFIVIVMGVVVVKRLNQEIDQYKEDE
jgi:hypothetical protein